MHTEYTTAYHNGELVVTRTVSYPAVKRVIQNLTYWAIACAALVACTLKF
jgi:hypothetical protein